MKDTNTAQQLCRTAFDEQFTDKMLAELGTAVEKAITKLEAKTQWRDQRGIDDRIDTAVMKLLDGTRKWEPSRCPLIAFLYQTVRSDVSAEIEHLANFPEAPLDDEHAQLTPVEAATIKTLETSRETSHAAAASYFSIVLADLRELAGNDKEVLKLLALHDEGIFDRSEIMARAKWSGRRYGTVYQRMIRLAQQLDDELRDSALDALAN